MCRLLGVMSVTPARLGSIMPNGIRDMRRLSHEHKDGWGTAWRDPDGTLHSYRCAEPAWTDAEFSRALAQRTAGQVLVHLRKASEGMAVVQDNCHPFLEGDVAFCHNGAFPPSGRLRRWAREHDARPCQGTTDSELYFAILLVHARTMDWPQAIEATVRLITEDVCAEDPQARPHALNCLVATPDALYAYSQHDPASLPAGSPANLYELRLSAGPGRVVVCSSGIEVPGARPVEQCRVITVHRDMRVEIGERLDLDESAGTVERSAA